MGRKTTSQWQFGELFEPPATGETEPAQPGTRVRKKKPPVPSRSEPQSGDDAGTGGPPTTEPAPADRGIEAAAVVERSLSETAASPPPPEEPEEARRIVTVSQLTSSVRKLLEGEFRQIWVTGEITNLRRQSSGHIYFSIKDSRAQLSCVLFRGERVSSRELLEDGARVLLGGDVTVYEPRGQYQFRVQAVELQGVGALQIAFEKLKKKLLAEGLFAQERKRPLPVYPQRIGLITSPTGAAIRDVIHVLQRRQPGLEVVLVPCRVQGEGAAGEISAGIGRLNSWMAGGGAERRLDLILVTRGGGSLEDLWAFNEEVLARAIYGSAIPVVSAVGHEIDYTISDFVADVRAATPSAAAEIITEGVFSSRQYLADAVQFLRRSVRRQVEGRVESLTVLQNRVQRVHPRRVLNEHLQHLDDLRTVLLRSTLRGVRDQRTACENLVRRLARLKPTLLLERQRRALGDLRRRMQTQARHQLARTRGGFDRVSTRLKLLGPGNTLDRGYSITIDEASGKIVRNAGEIEPGARLRTRLSRGRVLSVVESAENGS